MCVYTYVCKSVGWWWPIENHSILHQEIKLLLTYMSVYANFLAFWVHPLPGVVVESVHFIPWIIDLWPASLWGVSVSDRVVRIIYFCQISGQVESKVRGMFLHSAVSSSQNYIQSALHFTSLTARPVQSDATSTSLGSIQPYAIINAQKPFIHISITVYIARYSFIQLSELEQCRVKQHVQGSTPQHRIWTLVLLVESLILTTPDPLLSELSVIPQVAPLCGLNCCK